LINANIHGYFEPNAILSSRKIAIRYSNLKLDVQNAGVLDVFWLWSVSCLCLVFYVSVYVSI